MAVCECDGGRNLVDGGVSWLFALEGCAVEITQFCAATSQITQLSSVRGIDMANQRDSNPALPGRNNPVVCCAFKDNCRGNTSNSPVSMSCSLMPAMQMKA